MAAAIPAICNSCGTMFPGFTVEGNANFNLVLSGCTVGPCPTCGGKGNVIDGTYQFIGAALRRIADGSRTPEQLRQLQQILQQARQQAGAPREVPERIEAGAPEMSDFAAWMRQFLVPKNAGEFWQLIGVILAAIPLLMLLNQKQELDDKQIAAIVEKAVSSTMEKAQAQSPSQTDTKPVATTKKKVGRNDPCPCNSGKKYKVCCGSLANPSSQ